MTIKTLNHFNFFSLRLVFLLAIPLACYSQGSAIIVAPVLGPNGIPRAGATITICNSPATGGVPCTNYASIFQDIALTIPITQPGTTLKTDGLGNCCVIGSSLVGVFASPGNFTYTVSGVGIASPQGPYQTGAPCFSNCGSSSGTANNLAGPGSITGSFSGNSTLTGNLTLSGSNSFSGSNTLTGLTTLGAATLTGLLTTNGLTASAGQNILQNTNTINTDLYVGTGITTWAGSDIGAQLNSAYAACPSIGCTIWILPNGTSNTYNFTTPIVMNTSGKVASVRGMSSGNNGIQLNYTPTTATTAWTIDYTAVGGDSEAPKEVMRNITLINNGCTTYQGCGSSATGLLIGSANNGALNGKFTNIRVVGFSTDVSINNSGSWGMVFDNCTIGAAGTAFTTNSLSIEIITLRNCRIVSSTTGIVWGSGDLFIDGGSIDQNATGISQTGGMVTASGVHWEGQGANGTPLQCWSSTGGASAIYGGLFIDDVTGGAAIDNYFAFGGENFIVSGLNTFGSGRTVTTGIIRANASTRGYIFGVQQHTSATLLGGPNAAFVTSFGGIGTSSNALALSQSEAPIQVGGTKFASSGCSLSASTGGSWGGSYTSGTTGTCTVVITPSSLTNARNGWICDAHDITTPADVQNQTASSPTTATISGTTVSGDVVLFKCNAY